MADSSQSRKTMRYSVDQRSRDLAEYFLGHDREERVYQELAQAIQDCVEDFCADLERRAEAHKDFRARLTEVSTQADTTDGEIMLWARRHPRVCSSNAPTGEHIIYGGRRQL